MKTYTMMVRSKAGLIRTVAISITRVIACVTAFVLVSAFVAPGVTESLHAQTRFQQPDTTANIAGYQYVEECIAAVQRVSKTVRARNPIFVDTFERSKGDALREPIPSEAVAVARTCSAKFDPETVPLNIYDDWIRLYLMANRDDAAAIVAKRQLSETRQRNLPEYYKSAGILWSVYVLARPIRWTELLEMNRIVTESGTTFGTREVMTALTFQLGACDVYGDTIAGKSVAEQLITIANALTPAERESGWYQGNGFRHSVAAAYDYLGRHALIDSLRRSSTAYIALKRANLEKATGSRVDELPGALGKRAPTIVADFWFDQAKTDATQSAAIVSTTAAVPTTPAGFNDPNTTSQPLKNVIRPTLGKFALVVFLANGCRADKPSLHKYTRDVQSGVCWGTYAVIRRLAKRYPLLEITVVSQTTGYIGMTPVLTPQEEAQMMRSWWLGFHRVPAMLAVTNTKFFRLPAPDLRRIDTPTENAVNYTFGLGRQVGNTVAYLIDSDGTIIHVGGAVQEGEQKLNQMLSVITNRPK